MLQIARVQKEDAGKYTCQAVNEAGEDRMHFELEILGKQVHNLVVIKMYGIKCMYLEMIEKHFCCVYLFSPSCYYGSIRGVHGGNGSSGKQHCGPPL